MKDNWQNKIDEIKKEIERYKILGWNRCMADKMVQLTQLQEDKTLHEQELKSFAEEIIKIVDDTYDIPEIDCQRTEAHGVYIEELKKRIKLLSERLGKNGND